MKKIPKPTGRALLFVAIYFIVSPFLTSKMNAGSTMATRPMDAFQDQQTNVTGTITDMNGEPMAGVHVLVQRTTIGNISEVDGSFSIQASQNDTLVFSALGFTTQTIAVNGRMAINVQMEEDVTQLGEVVLNAGYYSVREKERTGNIAKVSRADIEQQPLPNPLAALQGRVAGVEIIQTSGVPGAGFDIRIRGRGSIRTDDNDPLYIVDGVPYASEPLGDVQTSGSILPGGKGFSPLNHINPADIESIEILKDADATAIYGSRGANGVVLITTRSGREGATQFDLDISTGFGAVAKTMDLLGTEDYLMMRREAFANDGIDPLPFNAYDLNGTWDQNRETDWQKVLFGKTAQLTDIKGTLSGGNERTRFLVSGSFNRQTTVFPGDFGNRNISVLANLHHRTKDDRLNFRFSANYSSSDNDLIATDLIREVLSLAPNAPALYQDDGTLNWENSTWSNPLRNLEGKYLAKGNNLIGNATVDLKLLEGLHLTTNLGFTQSHLKELRTIPSTTFDPAFGLGSDLSSAIHNNANRTSWIAEPQLNWNHALGHTKLDVLVGATLQERNNDRLSQFAMGFTNNALIENIGAASNLLVIGNSEVRYRYAAVFTRVNLNHRGRYILNLTGRRDGSSRFGPDNRFSNFGAVGAAWIFSREPFIKEHLPILSFGKLRGSYGTSGNDRIGDYQYLDTYSFGSAQYQNIFGLYPTRLFNPGFSWEENRKLEFALDLGFSRDRIVINGSYYRNRSGNQLVGIPLPATTGFGSLTANLNATVENTGWELGIHTVNLRSEHLTWTTDINLTLPKNRLMEFPGLEGSTYADQLVIGEPLNILKVHKSTGVDSQTGLYGFVDFNGDGIISAPEDRQVIKDLNPEYFGGVSNGLRYKNFHLDILFQFTKQLGRSYLYSSGIVGGMSNQPQSVLDRWQAAGDRTDIQRFTSGQDPNGLLAHNHYIESDATIEDASYLRLKTLSLSYTVPVSGETGFGCELFLRGQNLWTLTAYSGLDPETRSSSTIPPLRYITLGTHLTF
ncbi:SusC/RagA family TonB-linked outer membrane protein [Flagellimonas sp.]|uniref:SusC/RagA family TonB-linked outer membrane protein n=1 Tax=Flagellimonas sp. TaxID=2058762 RepID=UPI003BAE73AA